MFRDAILFLPRHSYDFSHQSDCLSFEFAPSNHSVAKTEMEMYTDLFNKISSSCYHKCASRKHRDQDLSLGEMTCTGMYYAMTIATVLLVHSPIFFVFTSNFLALQIVVFRSIWIANS